MDAFAESGWKPLLLRQEGQYSTTQTLVMEIEGSGCLVRIKTEHVNPDAIMAAEAITFVPHVRIEETKDDKGVVVGRKLKSTSKF